MAAFFLSFLFITLPAVASSALVPAVFDYSNELAVNGGVGLVAYSLSAEGGVCDMGVAGERIRGTGESMPTDALSRYHHGSVTKGMACTLLAVLMHEGAIVGTWESSLGTLLPELAVGGAFEHATLGQLVNMQSGLAGEPPLGWWHYEMLPGTGRARREAAARDALLSTPQAVAGTTDIYSNWAYAVAGHLIERALGMSWEEAIVSRLFRPLGICLSAAEAFGAPAMAGQPWGHMGEALRPCDPTNATLGFCDNPPVLGPGGTFSGPVIATAAYLAFHVRCHNGQHDGRLLSQSECVTLHTPLNASVSAYAYGWICAPQAWAGGQLVCTHDGSNTYNLMRVWMVPTLSRAYAAFTNSAHAAASSMLTAALIPLLTTHTSTTCHVPDERGTCEPPPAPPSAPACAEAGCAHPGYPSPDHTEAYVVLGALIGVSALLCGVVACRRAAQHRHDVLARTTKMQLIGVAELASVDGGKSRRSTGVKTRKAVERSDN